MLKCPNKNCCAEFSKGHIADNWKEFQSDYCPKCGNQVEGGWGINVADYRPVKVVPVKKAPAKKAPAKKAPAKKKAPTKKKTATKKD